MAVALSIPSPSLYRHGSVKLASQLLVSVLLVMLQGSDCSPTKGRTYTLDINPMAMKFCTLFDGKEGFVYVNQSREDYVAFLRSDNKERTQAVLVEIFSRLSPVRTDGNIDLGREFPSEMLRCFSGAQFGMQSVKPLIKTVPGQTQGSGSIAHLDPALIFKGKLRAAATRAKFHDSSDLRWLEARYRSLIKQKKSLFSHQYIGLALKRYPELHLVFQRLELDIEAASSLVKSQNPSDLPPPQRGDVQKGLLGM